MIDDDRSWEFIFIARGFMFEVWLMYFDFNFRLRYVYTCFHWVHSLILRDINTFYILNKFGFFLLLCNFINSTSKHACMHACAQTSLHAYMHARIKKPSKIQPKTSQKPPKIRPRGPPKSLFACAWPPTSHFYGFGADFGWILVAPGLEIELFLW